MVGAIVVQKSLLKSVGVVSLLLALAGCVSTGGSTPPSKAEQWESAEQLKACVQRNRAKFDNGKSDAIDVAIKIVDGPCAREGAALLDLLRRAIPPGKRGTYNDDVYPISYPIAQLEIEIARATR